MYKNIKSVIYFTILIMMFSYSPVFASDSAMDLQNFLNGYVNPAGKIVCAVGAVKVVLSFSSQSLDKRISGMKFFLTGIVISNINNIINSILR